MRLLNHGTRRGGGALGTERVTEPAATQSASKKVKDNHTKRRNIHHTDLSLRQRTGCDTGDGFAFWAG